MARKTTYSKRDKLGNNVPSNTKESVRHKRVYMKYLKPYRSWVRLLVSAIKSRPCEDCGGVFPPICMEFDHRRGDKHYNVGSMVYQNLNIAKVLAEIEKCDVVCANCHRIRTADERGLDLSFAGLVTFAELVLSRHRK